MSLEKEKNRRITVCNDMLNSLKRYRKHLGLPKLPSPEDQIPLALGISGASFNYALTPHISE
jgi:hypothetical protein